MAPRLFALLFAGTVAALAGCGKRGPDAFAEGEALEASGKLEEAAQRFELTCAYAPQEEKCPLSAGRAAEARMKAAEKAIGDEQFVAAEQLLGAALFTADDAMAQRIADRLASAEMTQRLAYERALLRTDKSRVAELMGEIAKTGAPVAALARAWLDRERPGLLVAAVTAACGPAHEGSCSEAAAQLKAAAPSSPEASPEAAAATRLAEAEERRIRPLLKTAEGLLRLIEMGEKQDAIWKATKERWAVCNAAHIKLQGGFDGCLREQILMITPPAADEEDRYQKRKGRHTAWEATMRAIADPAIARALVARGGYDTQGATPPPEKKP